MVRLNFAKDGIRTAHLWCWKRLLYQLSHHPCPIYYRLNLPLCSVYRYECALTSQSNQQPVWTLGLAFGLLHSRLFVVNLSLSQTIIGVFLISQLRFLFWVEWQETNQNWKLSFKKIEDSRNRTRNLAVARREPTLLKHRQCRCHEVNSAERSM